MGHLLEQLPNIKIPIKIIQGVSIIFNSRSREKQFSAGFSVLRFVTKQALNYLNFPLFSIHNNSRPFFSRSRKALKCPFSFFLPLHDGRTKGDFFLFFYFIFTIAFSSLTQLNSRDLFRIFVHFKASLGVSGRS